MGLRFWKNAGHCDRPRPPKEQSTLPASVYLVLRRATFSVSKQSVISALAFAKSIAPADVIIVLSSATLRWILDVVSTKREFSTYIAPASVYKSEALARLATISVPLISTTEFSSACSAPPYAYKLEY